MPAGHYVDIIRGRRVALLAGPFKEHEAAQAIKERALTMAYDLDPWTWFDVHGTCRYEACVKVGVLNGRLGLPTTVQECLQ